MAEYVVGRPRSGRKISFKDTSKPTGGSSVSRTSPSTSVSSRKAPSARKALGSTSTGLGGARRRKPARKAAKRKSNRARNCSHSSDNSSWSPCAPVTGGGGRPSSTPPASSAGSCISAHSEASPATGASTSPRPPAASRRGKIQLQLGATSYAPSHHIRLHTLTPERGNSAHSKAQRPAARQPARIQSVVALGDSQPPPAAVSEGPFLAHMPAAPHGFAWQLWPHGQQQPRPHKDTAHAQAPPSAAPVNNISIWNTNSREPSTAPAGRGGSHPHPHSHHRANPPRPRRSIPPFPEPCPTPIRTSAAQRQAALAPLEAALRPQVAPPSIARAVAVAAGTQTTPSPPKAPSSPAPIVPVEDVVQDEQATAAAQTALLSAVATLKAIRLRAAQVSHNQAPQELQPPQTDAVSQQDLPGPSCSSMSVDSLGDGCGASATPPPADTAWGYTGDPQLLMQIARADVDVVPLTAVSFSSSSSSMPGEVPSDAASALSSTAPLSDSDSDSTVANTCDACKWAASAAAQLHALQCALLRGMDRLAERVARRPAAGRRHEQRLQTTQRLLESTRAVALRMEVTKADLLHCARFCP